ncbi:hypothetical protein RJ53_06865 [Methanocalculus chunghsingensis]|uniref:Proteinase inhibitor I42 chagasin domain-containing protein n=1 Tax=Methanocalculus chunghsingensis TaxID=156457 RepID=A0A8J7WAD4_9EURY|nr:hypothetical protein [Methanocalculus chunghsingensis]
MVPPVTPHTPGTLVIFDQSNDGETYTVPVEAEIRLHLPENPTTGYQWTLAIPDGINLTGDDFTPPGTDLIGAPGIRTWEMNAGIPGTFTIEGAYIRPWETDAEPAETFSLTLVVE